LIVADASPLIFLAKVARLDVLNGLFGEAIVVPAAVADEVLSPTCPPAELAQLERFLRSCEVAEPPRAVPESAGLSRADRQALAVAIARRADLLLADDKVLRKLARASGIQPLGTVGVILEAVAHSLLSRRAARQLLDALVTEHDLHVGVEVYSAVIARLEAAENGAETIS